MKTDSIMQSLLECYFCHTTRNLQKHHIYENNPRRKLSDEDGCWVWLCQTHHTSTIGVHNDEAKNKWLKDKCQRRWMKIYNKTEQEFIERYGKSWLKEDFTG